LDMSAWQIHSWRGEAPAHPWRCLCAWAVGLYTPGHIRGSRAAAGVPVLKRATGSFAPVSLNRTSVATAFRRNVPDNTQVSRQTPQRCHLKAARCIVGPPSASSPASIFQSLIHQYPTGHRHAVTISCLTLAVATTEAPLGTREAVHPSRDHLLAVGTPVDPGNRPRPAPLAAPQLPPSAAARTDRLPPTAPPPQQTANHAPPPSTGCQRAGDMSRVAVFSVRTSEERTQPCRHGAPVQSQHPTQRRPCPLQTITPVHA
jgi:hypothetical protein